jgi:hypothetical protein
MDSGFAAFLGSLTGFTASLVPHVVELYRSYQQHTYKMEERQQELQAAEANYKFQIEKSNTAASTTELKALLAHDGNLTSSKWIQDLRASVRPVVTYLFVLLFIFVKVAAFIRFVYDPHVDMVTAITLLWDTETIALFSAVLSFWFGSRAMESYRVLTSIKK